MADATDRHLREVPKVYTIRPDQDFTRTLARNILDGNLPVMGGPTPDELDLVNWTVFVPTRRAARALTMAFVDDSLSRTRLLPRIRPLGDADEDEIAAGHLFGGQSELDIAPAASSLQRQFLLARLILDWARERPDNELSRSVRSATGQALDLAHSLGKLIDGFDNDEVKLDVIEELFGADLPQHRADVLDFMDVVRIGYPEALKAAGLSGPMERRSALIRAHADLLASNPPPGPVIAAGSTGSIQATAALLKQISILPQGAVVLPGLDTFADHASWQQLDQQHPQFGLKELLGRIGIERDEVASLPGISEDGAGEARCWFVSETMRPTKTSERWHDIAAQNAPAFHKAIDGLRWAEAPEQHDEARIISLLMRRAIDDPDQTVQLVTPDRNLARQVEAELTRWNIEVDDSAGEPLSQTPAGSFMLLAVEAASSGFSPRALMSLLDHPFCTCGMDRPTFAAAARLFEIAVLRGRLEAPDINSIGEEIIKRQEQVNRRSHPRVQHLADEDWMAVRRVGKCLQTLLGDLVQVFATSDSLALTELVSVHIKTAEGMSSDAETGLSPLWEGDAGESLSGILSAISEHGGECPAMRASEYADFIRKQLIGVPVRPKHVRHPRISIHGLLEARLIGADVTILGGLNEGVWPAEAEIDPWLNRPQRRTAELQLPERRIGLSAHDFAQAACARQVWMTSSRKIDGQPAVPTRWLLRMQAILKAAGLENALMPNENWVGWARGLDDPGLHEPVKPPKPTPPLTARPNRLSVTAIDKLIRDPYGIFARHILKLEPLENLEAQVTARERGNLVHRALQRFTEQHPGALPANAETLLLDEIGKAFAEDVRDPSLAAFWWPQMERIASWFIDNERDWRDTTRAIHPEVKGALEFRVGGRPFTLSGIADRIDEKHNGTMRLVDYKTGTIPAVTVTSKDYSAQLDLECQMIARGGFSGVNGIVDEAIYLRLSGGDPGGEVRPLKGDCSKRGEEAFSGLVDLLNGYADADQPYLPIGVGERNDRPWDFDHLSRWGEWGHQLIEDEG